VVTASNLANIKKDISENSYVTYSGKYYISQPFFKNSSFDQRSVDIGTESLTLRFTSISEWAETDGGEYEGTIPLDKSSDSITIESFIYMENVLYPPRPLRCFSLIISFPFKFLTLLLQLCVDKR